MLIVSACTIELINKLEEASAFCYEIKHKCVKYFCKHSFVFIVKTGNDKSDIASSLIKIESL